MELWQGRRFGFAVKVMGASEELKSSDARRAESGPHLRQSLAYVRAIFDYLETIDVRMYRMSSDLAPYLTHPERPEFHGQLAECEAEIRGLGELARARDLRLSFHPSQYIFLSAEEERIVEASRRDYQWQTTILDWMGLGREAVIVTHVGGAYGDKQSAKERWLRNYERLPEDIRGRLVLENDDKIFGVSDVLWIHERCGIPVVFDYQHHMCNNETGLPLKEAAERSLATWPTGVRPKIHFSSPSTTFKVVEGKGKKPATERLPALTNHADFINPFELVWFLEEVGDHPFDVMLEAKAKDVALLKLRRDLERLHPFIRARTAGPGAVTFLNAEAQLAGDG